MPHVAVLGAIVLLLAGAVAGATWAAVPAVGRARLGVNEIVATIMLNFVASALLSWVVDGPLREKGGAFPQTNPLAGTFLLPKIGAELQLHVGVFVAAAAVIAAAFVLARTALGYRLRIVGSGGAVARYLGISQSRNMAASLIVGGGLAGVAGAMQILGVQGLLIDGFDPGFGFDGLAAAFLGGGRPVGTAVAAVVLGGLHAGGALLQITTQLPVSAVSVLEAILIVTTLVTRSVVTIVMSRRVQVQVSS
jgi:simple sugar transport system permease protein